jgi:MFS family permease
MKTKLTYKNTIAACFLGYIVQAVVNNFAPLLFLTFQKSYGIPLSQITLLITFNFGVQLLVDLLSARFVDKIGYRTAALIAHGLSAAGMVLLALLPNRMDNAFAGLLIAVTVYAVGGGLLEVIISPIVESCPTKNKETTMSLLHSFYCWGSVGVVLISTLYFAVFGVQNWVWMALIWALLPLANSVLFAFVPLYPLVDETKESIPVRRLFAMKGFWIVMLMMACAGACEQSVSQWASAYAEAGLGVSKMIGDLAGPMFFSLCMGTSRAIYGKFGEKIDLDRFMSFSVLLCAGSYLLIALSPVPALGLLGCGICGFSVGIFWPGTFSMASASLRQGGTALFAFLALAGDIGCSGGPTFVGLMSGLFDNSLAKGILCALIFPVLMLTGILLNRRSRRAQPGK